MKPMVSRPPGVAAAVWATLRPNFLLLTPLCVLLGVATTRASGLDFSVADALGALLGALAAHASVNGLNEWHDWKSGLDATTQRTPFSGGSGALVAQPAAAPAALALALALLVLASGLGLYFLWRQGPALLPLGLAGLVLVAAYTPWVTRSPWLCLLAPGLGFGPLMVVGTQLALTGQHSTLAWAASLPPLCAVSGLLLLNQFPDVEADRAVGRRHLPMLWGRPAAARLWVGLQGLGLAGLSLAVAAGVLPAAALLVLLAAPLAMLVGRSVLTHADNLPALLPSLGRNVGYTLAVPLLLALGLGWGAG